MTRQKFEERTNIFLPMDMYNIVEFFYMDLDMDKDSFCTAYQKKYGWACNKNSAGIL